MSSPSKIEQRDTLTGTGAGLDFVELVGRTVASHARFPLNPHDHGGAYEICYLKRGSQTFFVGHERFTIHGGDYFITYPDEVHGTGHEPLEKSVLYWTILRPSSIDDAPAELRGTMRLVHTVLMMIQSQHVRIAASRDPADARFDALFRIWNSRSNVRDIAILNEVMGIVLDLHSAGVQDSCRIVSPEINAVVTTLRDHPESRRSVEEMAAIAGLSESQFRARFEAEIGTAPSDYATRVRIDRAKELLLAGQSVTEVAFELNFGSTQYFATVFKQFTGLNPSQYSV